MNEQRKVERSARAARRKRTALALLWLLAFLLPPLLGWAREVYAAATLLWVLPRRPVRPSLHSNHPEVS